MWASYPSGVRGGVAGLMNALGAGGFLLVLPVNMRVPWNKLPSSVNKIESCGRKQMEDTPHGTLLLGSPSTLPFVPGCSWDQSNRLRTCSAAGMTGKPRKPFVKVNERTQWKTPEECFLFRETLPKDQPRPRIGCKLQEALLLTHGYPGVLVSREPSAPSKKTGPFL